MAYHFQHGGCGIRSVLDIYLIRQQMKYDEVKLVKFLKEAQIETFYNHVLQLAEVWFSDKTHTDITSVMEEYILHGGTYGAKDNSIAVEQTKRGVGYAKYIQKQIFLPYNDLKMKYSILEKYKFLTPVYQVIRWIKMISDGKLKRYIAEFNISKNMSKEKLDSTEKLLKALELD